ncbi:hypothetical protein [Ralstonia solanacearum]|uniref:hypothetical protein n=1 Tax=Ralstonia solanacearum TaxID=305 RepID=UPI00168BEEC3|nr:hypothetical protein [Ralstonia solanacearum]QNT25976.1 hypothetical protein C2I38_028175 [Ralstonia solanacearum]QNT63558.1 hypothetical protein C2L97_28070 [Ralstonia solanacearum]
MVVSNPNDLLPIFVKSVHQYFGSFLKISGKNSEYEDVRLRVYLCDWVLIKDGVAKANSELSPDENALGLSEMVGAEICSLVKLEGLVDVCFNNGVRLRLLENTEIYEEDDDMFLIYFGSEGFAYNDQRGFRSFA